jgi:transposase
LALKEVFVPLVHPTGHAQADFGEAWAVLGGVRRKVHVLVVDLPQSDAIFLKAYLSETAEALCDGHVAAFAFFGGVLECAPRIGQIERLAIDRGRAF